MVQFMSLNEDCFYEIYKWLSLQDLCQLSKTCTRLQQSTGDYFQRKHPSKWLNVSRADGIEDGIVLSPNKSYVKCFSRNIQNLSIDFLPKNRDSLVEFLRTNCNNRPKIIQFKCTYLPETFVDRIKTILENVETIAFRNCLLEDGSIVNNCDRVKNLFLVENLLNRQYEQIEELLVGKYATLEHFHCRYAGHLNMDKVRTFLKNNKLKTMTWYFFRRHYNIVPEYIDSIVMCPVHLEELFLSFEGGNYNLIDICRKLKFLCDREPFKRLELQFIGEEAERKLISQGDDLVSLKSLIGLHLYAFRNFQSVVPVISKLTHLKVLQFKKDSEVDAVIFPLPNQSLYALPNLEQLHLIGLSKNFNYIHAFVLNATKLKMVVVKDCAFTEFHLSKLNESRKIQRIACETTIYTEQYNICTNLSQDLVKIKRVDFAIDEFNLSDPFICYTIGTAADD